MSTDLVAVQRLLGEVFDTLVRMAGVRTDDRDGFLGYMTAHMLSGDLAEYRVMGQLGWGGKLWWSFTDGFHVNAYPEDWTPSRRRLAAV